MTEPAFSHPTPIGLADISRLIKDTRVPRTDQLTGAPLISAITEVMSKVCDRAEHVAKSISPNADEFDADDINAIENRLLGVHDSLASIDIPQCLEWTDISPDVAALSPPALRGGSYYDSCDAQQGAGFFLRTLMWRYLAARFALHQTAQMRHGSKFQCRRTALQCFEESKQSIVDAARTQRRALGIMRLSRASLDGECIVLTIRKHRTLDQDACLLAVNELGENRTLGAELIARATDALGSIQKANVNHAIILADSLNNIADTHNAYFPLTGVHLVGQLDRIRYVFIVSSVRDHTANDPAEDEANSGVTLSKPRLRDAFWRRRSVTSTQTVEDDTRMILPQDAAARTAMPMVGKMITSHAEASQRSSNTESAIEPREDYVISRTNAARTFFGYRGLKKLDLQ